MAKNGIVIRGISNTIRDLYKGYNEHRDRIKKEAQNVAVFLQAETRKRAPVETGLLISTIAQEVIDRGRGRGFLIRVSAGNTQYARKMHEGIYRAWDHHKGHDNPSSLVTIKKGRGGLRAYQKRRRYQMTVQGQFWYDSQGYRHGRKYLERAWNDNKTKIYRRLELAGDRR